MAVINARSELAKRADEIYERYGRPLEADHWGEFVAIASDGRFLLASSAVDALERGAAAFGPGNFVFKIGPRAIGMIR